MNYDVSVILGENTLIGTFCCHELPLIDDWVTFDDQETSYTVISREFKVHNGGWVEPLEVYLYVVEEEKDE